jgi:hypothetical protein
MMSGAKQSKAKQSQAKQSKAKPSQAKPSQSAAIYDTSGLEQNILKVSCMSFSLKFDKTGKLTATWLALIFVGLPLAVEYGIRNLKAPIEESFLAPHEDIPERRSRNIDISALVGKNLNEIRFIMPLLTGRPAPLRKAGAATIENVWAWPLKDTTLEVRYFTHTKKIHCFALLSEIPLEKSDLLQLANLREDDPRYTISLKPASHFDNGTFWGIRAYPADKKQKRP